MKTQLKTFLRAALFVSTLCSGSFINGQTPLPDLLYSSGSTGADGALSFRGFVSPGRVTHATAFDAERGQVVLYGGNTRGGVIGDTWTWNGTNWNVKTPAQTPGARYDHAMAYDQQRKRVVLTGGIRVGSGEVLQDTWLWDGTNWTQALPTQKPPQLARHAMTFDPVRGNLVMFGGYDPTRGYINETWLWDGTNWQLASPSTVPPGRERHSMTFDTERGVVVMYTGNAEGGAYSTWTWDGTNWTAYNPERRPPPLYDYAMAYDPVRKKTILFGGYRFTIGGPPTQETWLWDGASWESIATTSTPSPRTEHALVYDSQRKVLVLTGGGDYSAETWLLNDTTWSLWSADYAFFDMAAKADGIWNYTTVDIPAGLTVYFRRNAANTPVRWLASGDVTINGFLNLNGENATGNNNPGNEAKGGPGGFAGGLGAIRFDQSSTYTGSPGQGPGGGAPGVGASDGSNGGQVYGKRGEYNGVYGNAYIQALVGGSGGGGGGSGYSNNGGNGGGGGGAILISSSRNVVVNGGIFANGGVASHIGTGGSGSGGSIRLVGDRISGGGVLQATAGDGTQNGRIRLEAYYRSLAGNSSPVSSISAPVATRNFDNLGALVISKVAGENVPQPPRGDTTNPDVLFSAAGDISIEVRGQGIPNNTPVTVRVTTANGIITVPQQGDPAVPLVNGVATFTVNVPPGIGTVQAFAEFTQQ